MKRIIRTLKNLWEYSTDGQKGSIIDVIKVVIQWIKIFWNAVSSQLSSILERSDEKG